MRRHVERLAFLLLPIGWMSMSPLANSQEVRVFSDWVAACDNLKTCSATSYSYNGSLFRQGSVQVYRDAGASAKVRVLLRIARNHGSTFDVRASVDGQHVAVFPDEILSIKSSERILDTLKHASVLSLTATGSEGVDISLKGLLAALRWMDEQQGRSGNVSALIARGNAPASALPTFPSAPEIAHVPLARQDHLPELDPQILRGKEFSECSKYLLRERKATRLEANRIAWTIPCKVDNKRESSSRDWETILMMTDDEGRNGEILHLSIPAGIQNFLNTQSTGINLQISGRIITSKLYPDNNGNGQIIRWQWDGKSFHPFIINALQANVVVGKNLEATYPLLYRAIIRYNQKEFYLPPSFE